MTASTLQSGAVYRWPALGAPLTTAAPSDRDNLHGESAATENEVSAEEQLSQAYEQGFTEGKSRADADHTIALAEVQNNLAQAISDLQNLQTRITDEATATLAEVIFEVVQQLAGVELNCNPLLLDQALRTGLAVLDEPLERVKVSVAAAECETLQALTDVPLLPDAQVQPGTVQLLVGERGWQFDLQSALAEVFRIDHD